MLFFAGSIRTYLTDFKIFLFLNFFKMNYIYSEFKQFFKFFYPT